MIDLNVLTGRHFDLPRGRQIIRLIDREPVIEQKPKYQPQENITTKELFEMLDTKFTTSDIKQIQLSSETNAGKLVNRWVAKGLVKRVGKIGVSSVFKKLCDKYPDTPAEKHMQMCIDFLRGREFVKAPDLQKMAGGDSKAEYIIKKCLRAGLIKKTDQKGKMGAIIYEVTL